MGILSPIGYLKYPIGDILFNWGLVICSLTLRYWLMYPQSPIRYFIPDWGFEVPNWGYYAKLGIFSVSSLIRSKKGTWMGLRMGKLKEENQKLEEEREKET